MKATPEGVCMSKARRSIFDPGSHFNDQEQALDRMEPAWAKVALALRGGPRFGHEATTIRAMSLVNVRETLEGHRRRFICGDGLALLQAVSICATENVPLPEWLAIAFNQAMEAFMGTGGPLTLDAIFKSPDFSGNSLKKAAAARQDLELGQQILVAMWKAGYEDETLLSLDATLESVLNAQRFGVGKTKARALFLQAEKRQIEALRAGGSNTKPLSQFLTKRRKRTQN